MSGPLHATNVKAINPGFPTEPCRARVALRWNPRPCSRPVHFLMPDSGYCSVHQPPEGLVLLGRRLEQWQEGLIDLYRDVTEARP